MRRREPRFAGPARRRAAASFDGVIDRFRRAGYSQVERVSPLAARLGSPRGRPRLVLELAPVGRVFGGSYGLEVSTEEPVLPPTRGISARGRGVVRMSGVRFRARRGDAVGRRLAERLSADAAVVERLGRVHFERIRIDADGRPVIRHLGGSVVWVLFPPLVRPIPLVPEQVEATVAALEALVAAGADTAGAPATAASRRRSNP